MSTSGRLSAEMMMTSSGIKREWCVCMYSVGIVIDLLYTLTTILKDTFCLISLFYHNMLPRFEAFLTWLFFIF
jgi:hypothetical protein